MSILSLKTRSQSKQAEISLKKQGLSFQNVLHGKREAQPPDRLSHGPRLARSRLGNTYLLPGNQALMTLRIRGSGDSMKDIRKLVKMTGLGGRGSNLVWHHLHDYNPETHEGTVVLMFKDTHRRLPHTGGSAKARAHDSDHPDKKSKLGVSVPVRRAP